MSEKAVILFGLWLNTLQGANVGFRMRNILAGSYLFIYFLNMLCFNNTGKNSALFVLSCVFFLRRVISFKALLNATSL